MSWPRYAQRTSTPPRTSPGSNPNRFPLQMPLSPSLSLSLPSSLPLSPSLSAPLCRSRTHATLGQETSAAGVGVAYPLTHFGWELVEARTAPLHLLARRLVFRTGFVLNAHGFLIQECILEPQFHAQRPSRTCIDSDNEEEGEGQDKGVPRS